MTQQPVERKTVEELAERYRNWGRWGADDVAGTLNFITPEKIVEAAQLVRKGVVFSLALPLDQTGPQTGGFGRINPLHFMTQDGGDVALGAQDAYDVVRWTDDALYVGSHSSTHWDSLAHIFHEGKMYNGHGLEAVTSSGARTNGVESFRSRMVSRGVLLDLPRYKGRPWLDPGEAIESDDLDGCARHQGLDVGEGDILLVRTGQLAQVRARGEWADYAGGSAPGFGLSAIEFLCERHVAAAATDTWGAEVLPNQTPDVFQPLHVVLIANAGFTLGEMWDMEELAEDCADDDVYEFMLVAPPLTITGGTGSPVNPQAIK